MKQSETEITRLAQHLVLGSLLDALDPGYQFLEHWQQGEFHHDLLISLPASQSALGRFLIVATNCNGGVKEILSFDFQPQREALWHQRCPESSEFSGVLPPVLARAYTIHWFDPCALLLSDALSEYRPEFRERQPGGGWRLKPSSRCPGH